MIFYDVLSSPLGNITASTDGTYITGLHLEGDRYFALPHNWQHQPSQPLLQQLGKELAEYFAAQRTVFDVPIHYEGTPFQQAVWSALQRIPAAQTTTYSELAAIVSKPRAVRAVGTAVGHNPLCIIVPCHRVIASDGSLGGYVAGLERKRWLLDHEKTLIN